MSINSSYDVILELLYIIWFSFCHFAALGRPAAWAAAYAGMTGEGEHIRNGPGNAEVPPVK